MRERLSMLIESMRGGMPSPGGLIERLVEQLEAYERKNGDVMVTKIGIAITIETEEAKGEGQWQ